MLITCWFTFYTSPKLNIEVHLTRNKVRIQSYGTTMTKHSTYRRQLTSSLTFLHLFSYSIYSLTLIMSPLLIEHLDIVTYKFETDFLSVKLPRYYPYHP
jgi:hypothetical protein